MAESTPARISSDSTVVVFEGRVQRIGDRDILRFPDDASAALPSRGQVAVKAAMNGRLFDTVIEPDGMRGHWLAVDEKLWHDLDISHDTPVVVEVEPTESWPEPRIPEDLQAALHKDSDITAVWNDITPMARWEWVRWINATRNPETRQRRVDGSISKLRSGKRRPCCFNLAACTDPELAKNGKLSSAI